MKQDLKNKIPKEVISVVEKLTCNGFRAWIVGGSVRDLLIGLEPKDWDVTTDAKPEQIQELFPRNYYDNAFGTVGVVSYETDGELEKCPENLKVIEVTPFRLESGYSDGRRPDMVLFSDNIDEDLKRRDFTINAIAYNPIKDILKDNFNGIKDIENKVLVAVGDPDKRFQEDHLRMLRAIRIANQLGFSVSYETIQSILKNSSRLKDISTERIRDELNKIFMSSTPIVAFQMLKVTGLLEFIIPELLLGVGMKQTENHKFDVYEHLLRSMQHAADKNYTLDMRITALLHDIAKPHTCRPDKSTGWNTFHGHEVVGERVSREILTRLKYPQETVSRVTKLIRWHMFNSDPDQVTMSAVRRMIVNVGRENIWDLMNLRFCDRIGSGRPIEEPHRLRRYFTMIEQALIDPIDLKMMKIDGNKIMDVTHETPGPRLRYILYSVFGEVLEEPKLNTEEYLVSRVTQLSTLNTDELEKLSKNGEVKQEEEQKTVQKNIKKKYKV